MLSNPYHFERSRLNSLFAAAINSPLAIVCAGAGYGKTSAIHDFISDSGVITVWIQLSERDNVGARFWENFTNSMAQVNKYYAQTMSRISFPDTDDKLMQFKHMVREFVAPGKRIFVVDDTHLIEDPDVLHFIEWNVYGINPNTSVVLLSRATPRINIASLVSKGLVYNISEDELKFTEEELTQYFRRQEISARAEDLRSIIHDTKGWAFAINLAARSYHKSPAYDGYLRNALRTNIFQLMESEVWSRISENLGRFLIRLSLIGHLSVDLIELLADGDDGLITELERQCAYVRRDDYISAYLIHHLFLEYLRGKHDVLTETEKRETYEIAAHWCDRNGFRIDALGYYEKIGDYGSIVRIFFNLPTQVPQDIARYAIGIFERAPAEALDRVGFLAVMHVRTVMCLGRLEDAFRLMEQYEAKYTALPPDSDFRNQMLGGLYYCWGITRTLMCTKDDHYDFDCYYAKMDECLTRFPADVGMLANHPCGPWISLVGTSREGALQEFIDSFERATLYVSRCMSGAMMGLDDLAKGELKLYQGDARAAEALVILGLERAREYNQYETMHRALFYLLRIAMLQGNLAKAQQAMEEMKALLDKSEYPSRFITYDIALGWFYSFIDHAEKVPDWLTERFTPYGHAYFIENFGNQVKARYCYRTKDYPLLLSYIEELRKRESIIFGRVEMFAMEACIHYMMKDRDRAFAALKEVYSEAAPNGIILPLIGLGKDMRTLISAAVKAGGLGIPEAWLEEIGRKAASYAKRHSHIIAEYRRANNMENEVTFSQRETEILTDLSHGLSRKEIAASRGISVNTVKMMIGIIYNKLSAENLADLIRIATEKKII